MPGTEWYYQRGGERMGPISREEVDRRISIQQLLPQDLVWTEGMTQWQRVADVAALQAGQTIAASAGAANAAAPVGSAIDYYRPSGGLPPRAAATLAGHAVPEGDTGDWPLDDARVAQFEQAVKLRKRVTGAANLYKSLLFLSIIGGVILLLCAVIIPLTAGGNRASTTAVAIGLGVATVVVLAFAALYYFVWRATMRSHRWAPLTMLIIYVAGFALQLLGMVVAASRNPADAAGGIVGGIFAIAFAAVSWKSYKAIPQYLAQPAWCQELLVRAGM